MSLLEQLAQSRTKAIRRIEKKKSIAETKKLKTFWKMIDQWTPIIIEALSNAGKHPRDITEDNIDDGYIEVECIVPCIKRGFAVRDVAIEILNNLPDNLQGVRIKLDDWTLNSGEYELYFHVYFPEKSLD